MARRYLLGFDVGSSSVKASLTDVESGEIAASAFYPDHEAPIMAVKAGWAEQDPQMWWENAKLSLKKIMAETGAKGEDILAIGISYQMHGLVCVDKNQQVCFAQVSSGVTLAPCLMARKLSTTWVRICA